MKIKLFILCLCCIAFLSACNSENNKKEKTDTKKTEETQNFSDKSEDIHLPKDTTEENITNTEGIEKIKSIIEQEQKDAYILDVSFYSNYMYLAVAKEDTLYLQQYTLDSWEKKEINTALPYKEEIRLLPYKSGVEVIHSLRGENRELIYKTGHKYIYNDRLELLYSYENIFLCNAFYDNQLYIYEQENANDQGILYSLHGTDKSRTVVRDFRTETVSGHEIYTINKLYISSDGRYLYFSCHYQNEEKTKLRVGWGILDLQDSSNDILYEEVKDIEKSENGIIVMDAENINIPSTLTDSYSYFDNQNKKTVKHLKNKEESSNCRLSYEGNILLTQEVKKGIIRIYDFQSDSLLYEKTDSSLEWMGYADICEKYHMVLGLEMIHESNEEFSPTGKYHILIEQY